MKKLIWCSIALFAAGCSDDEEGIACVAPGDFDAESGWELASYAPRTTEPGCYPFNASSTESFGDFISMRTNATAMAGVEVCATVFDDLNCGTYEGDDGTLSFNVVSADRLTMRVTGSFQGREVDTVLHFNPCQPGCLSAVTLETIHPEQQTICEIPSQLAVCLFPDDAHNLSFARVGRDAIELRLAGGSFVLGRE